MTEMLKGVLDMVGTIRMPPQGQDMPPTQPAQKERQPDPAHTSSLLALARRIEQMEKCEERVNVSTRLGLDHF